MSQANISSSRAQHDLSSLAVINENYLMDEEQLVSTLLEHARSSSELCESIHHTAATLVEAVREQQKQSSGLHAFLNHYDLSSHEGIVLMCLAEALLRIPDSHTIDELIADKLSAGNWEKHVGESDSFFVNASTWALMLTGKTLESTPEQPKAQLTKLFNQFEEPVIRAAVKTAMRIMAFQFVMGRDIEEGLKRSNKKDNRAYRYSFDMLGEAAMTMKDADRYQSAYATAIINIGQSIDKNIPVIARPSISIKLSALHPRYEYTQQQRACVELSERLLELACLAKKYGIGLTVDAEEAERLELSLMIFENVYLDSALHGWDGLGLAVQAYQKRTLVVLRWLNTLSQQQNKLIPVRLVKGAYWDTEIKHAQELGLKDYPVFTRKCNTDVSYLACARYLLDNCSLLYPQFATHNAHTLSYIYHHAKNNKRYEFQRLHGMGEELYAEVIGKDKLDIPCRVYAPVGPHKDLLPYLVRRLLENGANTSFVNQILSDDTRIEDIIADPVELVDKLGEQIRHPGIVLPSHLFGEERLNSKGINFADANEFIPLLDKCKQHQKQERYATPVVNGAPQAGKKHVSNNPSYSNTAVGHVDFATAETMKKAVDAAYNAWPAWNNTVVEERAAILEKTADLYEQNQAELLALCVSEAGKSLQDSHAEIREAIDFLRYYAFEARKTLSKPVSLPGPTGESNTLHLNGRGVFLCISPWNFPVAIYTGQIAAALLAGNTVLAKPAEQTSVIADFATDLMYQAGLPKEVLQFLPAKGELIGNTILDDSRINGVAFTGSTGTARLINQKLALRPGPIATLIAETGGQNAMLVDSSALPEQVVSDVVQSAFNSAGQRCSALRVLYLQEDIADRIVDLLIGHMNELVIGDPTELSTDVGPVIDKDAKASLEKHIESLSEKIIHQCTLPQNTRQGYFVAPTVIEIENIGQLDSEHFGPVLHIIRYKGKELDRVLDEINNSGFGLTFGMHSRIEQRAEYVRRRMRVGNVYINRNMVGAVVGVQPFGGCGLSGTGPKAGGPNYLHRFATEQTCTINTTAIGGNASLLTLTK